MHVVIQQLAKDQLLTFFFFLMGKDHIENKNVRAYMNKTFGALSPSTRPTPKLVLVKTIIFLITEKKKNQLITGQDIHRARVPGWLNHFTRCTVIPLSDQSNIDIEAIVLLIWQ